MNRKNSIGSIAFLVLIVLLSQSKMFDFLIDTALGRLFLISVIMVLSYVNQILGVVSVLMVILLFNASGFRIEGFDTPKALDSEPVVTKSTTTTVSKIIKDPEPEKKKEGFATNILAIERTLQKGKSTGAVNSKQSCENMSPYDGVEAFTAF